MELFPSIDLLGGKCVRLLQGDYDREINYDADPLEVAGEYARAGSAWVHVVDLDAARTGEPTNTQVIADIAAKSELKVQVGGGIRTSHTVQRWLHFGVQRLVIGTAAFKNWAWFEDLAGEDACQGRLVLGLDARDGQVATDGWTLPSQQSALDVAKAVNGWPLAAINYTDISRDGMLEGPNLAAIEELAAATDVPIVASGGVSSLDDLRALSQLPIAGVIVGRALYEQRFTTAEALAAVSGG